MLYSTPPPTRDTRVSGGAEWLQSLLTPCTGGTCVGGHVCGQPLLSLTSQAGWRLKGSRC